MKIAIFGGSFDPVHRGHVAIVRWTKRAFRFDQVLIVPTKNPPHKRDPLFSDHQRVVLLQKAFRGIKKLKILDVELKKKKTSYTYDLLRTLRRKYPNGSFYFLVGLDSFESFPSWYRFPEFLFLSEWVVVRRSSKVSEKTIRTRVFRALKRNGCMSKQELIPKSSNSDTWAVTKAASPKRTKVYFLKNRPIDLSSTKIRSQKHKTA